MVKWIAWLNEQMQQAIEEDDMLLDADAIGIEIFRARYGDDAYHKRLERTKKHGIKFIDYPYSGKKNKNRYLGHVLIKRPAA
ncbi:hypothetical protein [Nitrobacter sp. JJSN]|uniref:hypothetical protein n=1 Tax=Nitrobacter sp. JJSN TaxID=3453033 RepID=UPI003F7667D5